MATIELKDENLLSPAEFEVLPTIEYNTQPYFFSYKKGDTFPTKLPELEWRFRYFNSQTVVPRPLEAFFRYQNVASSEIRYIGSSQPSLGAGDLWLNEGVFLKYNYQNKEYLDVNNLGVMRETFFYRTLDGQFIEYFFIDEGFNRRIFARIPTTFDVSKVLAPIIAGKQNALMSVVIDEEGTTDDVAIEQLLQAQNNSLNGIKSEFDSLLQEVRQRLDTMQNNFVPLLENEEDLNKMIEATGLILPDGRIGVYIGNEEQEIVFITNKNTFADGIDTETTTIELVFSGQMDTTVQTTTLRIISPIQADYTANIVWSGNGTIATIQIPQGTLQNGAWELDLNNVLDKNFNRIAEFDRVLTLTVLNAPTIAYFADTVTGADTNAKNSFAVVYHEGKSYLMYRPIGQTYGSNPEIDDDGTIALIKDERGGLNMEGNMAGNCWNKTAYVVSRNSLLIRQSTPDGIVDIVSTPPIANPKLTTCTNSMIMVFNENGVGRRYANWYATLDTGADVYNISCPYALLHTGYDKDRGIFPVQNSSTYYMYDIAHTSIIGKFEDGNFATFNHCVTTNNVGVNAVLTDRCINVSDPMNDAQNQRSVRIYNAVGQLEWWANYPIPNLSMDIFTWGNNGYAYIFAGNRIYAFHFATKKLYTTNANSLRNFERAKAQCDGKYIWTVEKVGNTIERILVADLQVGLEVKPKTTSLD